MSAPHGDQIVAGYLAQLELALGSVAPSRRAEIVDEIREHIAHARAQLVEESDADVHNILDRLGDPAVVAASAREEEPPPARASSLGWVDIAAVVLTPIFWPAGVILLWMSPSWSTRDKLIGTLVPPGGYIGTYLGLSTLFILGFEVGGECSSGGTPGDVSTTCTGTMALPGALQAAISAGMILVFILWLVLPVLTGIYLGVRLRRRTARSTTSVAGVAALQSR